MITSAPPIQTPLESASETQSCGPVRHFQRQARAGALQDMWTCPACGKVSQPFSAEQILLMRRHHGVGLEPV
jgi:hypothetical protein